MRSSPGRGTPLFCAGCVLGPLLLIAALGCQRTVNYPSSLGPRYAGGVARLPGGARSAPDDIHLVTFNIQFGRRLESVIELLQVIWPAKGPDIVTLQEVDNQQIDHLAHALEMSYVYYPTVVHPKTGRNYGNAILSRWPMVDDRKVILPHHGRWRDAQRAATAATILVGDDTVRVYSVHLSTMAELTPLSRREQARTVLTDAAAYRRVVVGGDMNSIGVGEEFLACGFRWPTRDNEPTHHVFTWDHIFLKGLALKDSTSTGVVSQGVGVSDHLPVWAIVQLGLTEAGSGDRDGAPGEIGRLRGCAAASQDRM